MKGLPRSSSRGAAKQQEIVKQTFPIKNLTVACLATSTAVGIGASVIGDFPAGNILFLGASASIIFSGSGADSNLVDTWNGDYAVGTTPNADGTLSGTEVNIIASTAIGPAVAEVAPAANGNNATQAFFDNTDNSLELNLNVLIDAADITDNATVNLTANGYVTVAYIVM